jgi:hypothetical protein
MNKGLVIGAVLGAIGLGLYKMHNDKEAPPAVIPEQPDTQPDIPPDKRTLVVSAALGELGQQDAKKYWSNVLPHQTVYPKDWCGGFALWALHQAGLATDTDWAIGKGFCYELPMTMHPEPGDIAYFDQPYQHHAIVVSLDGDTLTTVDGNQPGQTVRERQRSVRASKPAFYSIAPLLPVTVGA